MSAFRVRAAAARDVDAAMQVMERAFDPAFGEAWTRGQCLATLTLPDTWLTLAEAGAGADGAGDPLGFALSRLTGDDAELLLLAVDPAARRQGIGTALIASSVAGAEARGATRLLIEVRANNAALALYAREGFGKVGRRPAYYRGAGGVTHDGITLARALSSSPRCAYPAASNPPDWTA